MGETDRLQEFVNSQKEPALYKWWGQFLEANEEMQEALHYYKDGNDFGSCVRILCAAGDINSAI